MGGRARSPSVVLFCGIILSNVVVASSDAFGPYAPLQMSSTWLLLASLGSGLLLGLVIRDEAAVILYGVLVMALIAVAGFSGMLLVVTWLSGSRLVDVILVYALQQAFPRVISISLFGYGGAFGAIMMRLALGSL